MKTSNIYLFGEINYESAGTVIEKIDSAIEDSSCNEILLTICSFGGYNLPAFALCERIKSSPKKIIIKAAGACQSCAVIVLQAGHKRLATEQTFFMLHQIESPIERPGFSALMNEADLLKKEFKLFKELTLNKSNMSEKEFDKKTQTPFNFSSEEALTYGFIDEIVK
ncbi:hypothetical protein BH09PAT2_BH09PAT2_05880 [soil metagenome]